MASLACLLCHVGRTTAVISRNASKSTSLTAVRTLWGRPSKKSESDEKTTPVATENTGSLGLNPLQAMAGGLEDPFQLQFLPIVKGTVEEPTLVPSVYETRLVGCICEQESEDIKWLQLKRGEDNQCYCGFWFRLVDIREDMAKAAGSQ